MKIGRYIKLTNNFSHMVADIGGSMDIEEKGVILIVLDIDSEIKTTNINIVPCKVIHFFEIDNDYLWQIENTHFVFKKHIF